MSSKIYTPVELRTREQLSADFDRLTFSGEGLIDFPEDCAGGYIKLMFDRDYQPLQKLPEGFPEVIKQDKPVVRSFTIARFHKSGSETELCIDMAINKKGGVAANWASEAQPGDEIYIVGPGKSQPLAAGYDTYFVAGDETAIPAINVHLSDLLSRQGHLDNVRCVVQCHGTELQALNSQLKVL